MITQRSRHIQILTLGFFVTAAVGCAANLPETRQGRAAGEWQFHLPATRSSIGGLAFGSGGSSVPADRAVAREQPAQPLMAAAVPAKAPRVQRVRHVSPAPVVPEATPVKANDSEEAPAVAPTTAPAPVQLAQAEPSADQRYREREATTPKLEQFRGGDAIVISVSALLIVLLIVILILLLR